MMLSILMATFVLVAMTRSAECKGKERLLEFNFDDITVVNDPYISLPLPYHGFIFRRVNPGNIMDSALLLNTTYSGGPAWSHGATSLPNLIFSTKPLTISFSSTAQNEKAFTLLNFTIAPIWWNPLPIVIQMFRNDIEVGRKDVILEDLKAYTIVIDQANIDLVIVAAAESVPIGNRHLAYDSFNICK